MVGATGRPSSSVTDMVAFSVGVARRDELSDPFAILIVGYTRHQGGSHE